MSIRRSRHRSHRRYRMSYTPPSLAPLVITPQLAAHARASAEATPTEPPSSVPFSSGLESLVAMFPTYDKEVLGLILAENSNNVENAVTQLLEMTAAEDGAAGPGPAVGSSAQMDADEELAMALMQQFAGAHSCHTATLPRALSLKAPDTCTI